MIAATQSEFAPTSDFRTISFSVPTNNHSDGELLKLFMKTRDETILVSLMEKYKRQLMAYILKRMRHYHDAEAVLNATWSKIVLNGDKFDVGRSFSPFLYKIAATVCVDLYRRELLRHRKSSSSATQLDTTLFSIDPFPPAALVQKEEFELLRSRINLLGSPHKEYITNYYLNEVPLAELDPDLPINTVKSRLHKARILLRDSYKKDLQRKDD